MIEDAICDELKTTDMILYILFLLRSMKSRFRWGAFSGINIGPLVETLLKMKGSMYKDILPDYLLFYWLITFAWSYFFLNDTNPVHVCKIVKQCFQDKKIPLLKWPTQSTNIIPIENISNELHKRMRKYEYFISAEFTPKLEEQWEKNY